MNTSFRTISEIIRFAIGIIAAVLLAVFIVQSFFGRVSVDNNSMSEVVNKGDTVLIDRLCYSFTSVDRFDIICFENDNGISSIKRVIALPGESIRISSGKIYIDDSLLEMPEGIGDYTFAGLAENGIRLGDDEYFVLGDNSTGSDDSRFSSVGNVKRSSIDGRVWFRIAPFSAIGFVSGD
ncbi:MAG: signal peptidase I [Lachnospiraceae bacterium]|nr:signal peptidase I [Lachnospiraceae bacterium]